MNRTRIQSACIAAIAALALAAGGALAAEPIVLTVMMQDWGDAGGQQVFREQIVPRFEAMYPGVKVDIAWTAWDTYVDTYLSRYAGGVMPDVVSIGSSGLGQFVETGMIRPIDEFISTWDGLSDIVPPAIVDGQINGRTYSIAYRLDVRTLVYNARLFEEAGLPDAQPRTWDELLDAARRLVRKDGSGRITREGFDVRADWQHVLPFIYQNGGGYVSADGRRALLGEPEVIEAVEFLHKLIYEDGVSTPGATSFINQANAMMYDGTWLMDPKLNPIFADTRFAEPLTKRRQATQVHINKFAVSSTSEHPDLAWEWIKFVMEPENLALISEGSPRLTPRISALQYPPFNADPQWHTWLVAATMSEPSPGFVPTLAQIAGRFNQALSDVFNNRATAQARMQELARDLDTNWLR